MGVIYIGDRNTGKTSLVLELAHPSSQFVKVTDPLYNQLKALLYNDQEGKTMATDASQATYDRQLEIEVTLPSRPKNIYTEWIDTPGEIWRSTWQKDNPNEWEKFMKTARRSQGVCLVLSPYREIIRQEDGIIQEDFITRKQWIQRFERWVKFFRQDCRQAKHLVLCLNKADLIRGIDLKEEAQKLAYHPVDAEMNWMQRNDYVFKRFFGPLQSHIAELNQYTSGLSVRCFITSIYSRELVELPWIYLGTYLSNNG
nr:GTPase domain-containing protein [Arthrospira sp. SH-MAG29]